jgi:hypothetical protein
MGPPRSSPVTTLNRYILLYREEGRKEEDIYINANLLLMYSSERITMGLPLRPTGLPILLVLRVLPIHNLSFVFNSLGEEDGHPPRASP